MLFLVLNISLEQSAIHPGADENEEKSGGESEDCLTTAKELFAPGTYILAVLPCGDLPSDDRVADLHPAKRPRVRAGMSPGCPVRWILS